ncbi:hypothetical protein [Streptomyces sp. NPDC002676]
MKLWERVEDVLDVYDAAGAPGPETFTLPCTAAGSTWGIRRCPVWPRAERDRRADGDTFSR